MSRKVLLLTAVAALASTAHAAEHPYISAGSEHEYAVLTTPTPAQLFGELSVETLAGARAFFERGPGGAQPPPAVHARVIGGAARGAAPLVVTPPAPAWSPAAPAPFGAPLAKKPDADCRTVVGDISRERVAAIYTRRKFRVGAEAADLRLLRMRVLYQDGLVAWINGVEVARKNVDARAAADAVAQRPRGSEWETFYLPVTPGLLRAGDNELVIEVRPSVARLAPSVDVELTGHGTTRVVRGPVLLAVAQDRATIAFESDGVTAGAVVWSAPGLPERRVDSPGRGVRHEVALSGLPAGGEIRYRIVADDDVSPEHRFHTAPARGEVVRFVVFGDVRTGHDRHAELAARVTAEAPDFVLSTGDMVMRGTDEGDWQKMFLVGGPLFARIPVYPVLGNHDLGETGERRFEDIFALTQSRGRPADCPPGSSWWSFDVGDVHIAVLDSNHYDDPRQLAWLDQDLAAARRQGARRLFAAAHHGAWSRGPHGGHTTAAELYAPLLERHGVAVLFSGHDHLYQRGQVGKLRYVVSGGGGAPLYPVRCGGRGQRSCGADGMAFVESAYHYVVVEVYRDFVRMCPRRPDGSPLEACTTFN